MLDWCGTKLADEGLTTDLYPLAIHELEIPKTYKTIINCGAFGLGGVALPWEDEYLLFIARKRV